MEQHYRCILFCFVIAGVTILTGVYAQVLDGPSPANQAVLVGTDHTLRCRRGPDGAAGSVAWEEDTVPTVILFVDGTKQVTDDAYPKYSNFNLDPDNFYDLVISSIAVEDEGTYECRNFADPTSSQTATRTVEVRSSSLDISQGGSFTSLVTVTEGEPSDVVCTTVGARPVVNIDWYHMTDGGSETKITDGVSQVDTSNADNADIFDSVSTLNYTASKDYDGGSLRCVTTGQEVAESRQDTASLNVQFPPEITSVLYANKEVICNANANPEATSYAIIVNYSEVFDPAPDCSGSECRFTYEVQEESNIRCNATNDLGVASKDTQATPGATMPPPPTTESQPLGTTKSNANGGGGSRITAAIIFGLLLSISSSCFCIVY